MHSLDGIRKVSKEQSKSRMRQLASGNFAHLAKTITLVFLVILFTLLGGVAVFSSTPAKNTIDLYQLFKDGKYLVLFQNDRELRATGGFIGSYATVEVKFGQIVDYQVETNIYKRDDKYNYMLRRTAPEPLQRILGDRFWSMHDANWWVSYPQSAEEVEWFYKNEGGGSLDGVMAIDTTFVEDLLKITGGVELPDYDLVIDSDNFNFEVQKQIDKDYYQSTLNQEIDEPKTILKDLAPKLMEKLSGSNVSSKLLAFLRSQLKKKNMLLYFNNPTLERLVLSQNWGGSVTQTDGDYLYVNNSNLGGGKSSQNISQELRLTNSISNNEVQNSLTVTRVHQGDGKWPDCDNINYLRILVPAGSQIIAAELDKEDVLRDVTVDFEAGKTVFGLWMSTPAKSTKILKINYKLSIKIENEKSYNLVVQKQSGSPEDDLEVTSNSSVLFNGKQEKDLQLAQ